MAERPGLEIRKGELSALADALGDKDPTALEPWIELDLLAAYARRESLGRTGPRTEHRAWTYAEAALGALVFVPLMVTWYGLTRASSAYEALIGENPKAATRPFLQLWQSGFEGHLTGAFTFGHVAMSATAAIGVLFALVLVHGLRRAALTRREEAAERDAEDLMAQLVPVLTRAQLVLNEHRLSSPQRFSTELTQAAATLTKLGNKAVRVHKDLTSAAGIVGDAVQAAESRLAEVDDSVQPLAAAVTRVETAVSENGTRLTTALGDVRGAHDEVRLALENAGERVEQSVTVLAASQRAYTTGIEVTTDVVTQLLGRLSDITESTARAVEESQRAARELGVQTGALRGAAESFTRLADELRLVNRHSGGWGGRPSEGGGDLSSEGWEEGPSAGRAHDSSGWGGHATEGRGSHPAEHPADRTRVRLTKATEPAGTGEAESEEPGEPRRATPTSLTEAR
ncbi:methyl-accepting chemotaxis protein [Streptomyces sp. NPDC052687]|uniref:methyl-accepting chemotaxis protein n=1 Tax=Streptomyces sp. NPDC052687 TaxID=3154759 RepID=UPI00341A84F3